MLRICSGTVPASGRFPCEYDFSFIPALINPQPAPALSTGHLGLAGRRIEDMACGVTMLRRLFELCKSMLWYSPQHAYQLQRCGGSKIGISSYSCVAASPMSSLRLATCCSSMIPNLPFVWTCSSLGSEGEAISLSPDCRASVSKEATYASFMYAKLKPSVIEAMCGGRPSGIAAAGLLDSLCLQYSQYRVRSSREGLSK